MVLSAHLLKLQDTFAENQCLYRIKNNISYNKQMVIKILPHFGRLIRTR